MIYMKLQMAEKTVRSVPLALTQSNSIFFVNINLSKVSERTNFGRRDVTRHFTQSRDCVVQDDGHSI